jgi:hypothetical protein
MKKNIQYSFLFLFLFSFPALFSQNFIIKGRVIYDRKPVSDCNVYIEKTLTGTLTDDKGNFEIVVRNAKAKIKLIFTIIGYKDYQLEDTVENFASKEIVVNLYQITSLNEVVIFSDKKVKAGYISGLSSLDLITTPSALGDAMTAISTSLPGNQIDPNDGRFFVRGGDHYETKVFINDLNVHTPFTTNGPSLPNRGRFSPFLFDGIAFSAGGFESEYGRALSSVLLMDTKKFPAKDELEISVKSVGLDASITHIITPKASVFATLDYTNLGPYRAVFPSVYKWNEDYNTLAGEFGTILSLKKGTFKSYNKYDQTRLDYERYDLGFGRTINTRIYEKNYYTNSSLQLDLNPHLHLFSGMVYSYNQRDIYGIFSHKDNSFVIDKLLHLKSKLDFRLEDIPLKLKFGLEYFDNGYNVDYKDDFTGNQYKKKSILTTSSTFVDVEYKISPKLIFKSGIRSDYTKRLNELVYSPRIRFTYEAVSNFTISPYYGLYNQTPQNGHLIFDEFSVLNSERATQKGINLYWNKDKRLFFIDAYKKKYDNLVKYDFEGSTGAPRNFNNDGSGYANGVDVFFWDRKSIKNLEYRISYTYIDAKRNYQDYKDLSLPGFYSKHNSSVVTKYWVENIRSLISLSYIFSSGNPYTNPNKPGFNNSFIKPYNSLNISYSFLMTSNLFLYASASNVLGFSNVASYDYASKPDENGIYAEQKILPASSQFFFVGMFYKFGNKKEVKEKMKEVND